MAVERASMSMLSVTGIAISLLGVAVAFLTPPLGVAAALVGFVLSGLGLLLHRDAEVRRPRALAGVLVSTGALVVVLFMTLTTTVVRR